MSLPDQKPTGASQVFVASAWLYLLLLPADIRVHGPIFLHDLLAPVFVVALLLRRNWRSWLRLPDVLLPVFLVLAGLATIVHGKGGRDIYELAIAGYMAAVFAFFVDTPLRRRHLAWYGVGVLGIMWVSAAWRLATGAMESYGVYEQTTLAFIAKRFFFTFDHPNLAGSFYALPVACLLLGIAGRGQRLRLQDLLLGLVALAALLVPLGLTVSKHMLLSAALIAGAVVVERGHAAGWRWVGLVAVAGAFVLFYLTVLFPFFPLQRSFPFFNHATWGMYTTHQSIYWRILTGSLSSLLVGVGPQALRGIYPALADPEHIRAVLAQYDQAYLTESFCTYMDSHNEYLNTGVAFGLPALLAWIGFWVGQALTAFRRQRDELVLFFVIGLLCCCLWDDLASKRWIWVTAALLVGNARREAEPVP